MSGIENDVLVIKNVNFDFTSNPPHNGIVSTDGQLLIGSTTNPNISMVANTLTEGTGIEITNGPGTITIATTASLTDLHTAQWIVNSTPDAGGTHTTIASAIASASSGDTIFVMPGNSGTYTESFTWPAGINITAYNCDALTPNVTIIGNITCNDAGSRSMSGIRLQTNGAAFLTVSGSAATVVNLDYCYLNCTNATGISFSSSSASSQINIDNSDGNLATTGIAYFAHSSSGLLYINSLLLNNSGASTTASTCSAGSLFISDSNFASPITTSGTSQLTLENTNIDTNAQNVTALTAGGSGSTQLARFSRFASGTASAVSVGTTLIINNSEINSSNTNAMTGAGSVSYRSISFTGSSSTINTTTRAVITSGTFSPTLIGTVAGTTTYSSQNGYYTLIEDYVFIQGSVVITAATGTGNAILGGFPFNIRNLTGNGSSGSVIFSSASWAWPGGTTSMQLQGVPNGNTALFAVTGTAAAAFLQMTNGAANVSFSLFYKV